MISRRQFVQASGWAVAAFPFHKRLAALRESMPQSFAVFEKNSGGRLGVAVHDTGSKQWTRYRAAERFPMCSTFKVLLAAAILQQCDKGQERIDRKIQIARAKLVPHSPITEQHAGAELPIRELCGAILTESDNTAANLLLEAIGGPAAVTRFARAIGDEKTRLDRMEPELNEGRRGDPRDTTTPETIVHDMEVLLLGDVLHAASRNLLTNWLIENRYGLSRLRAHVPAGWRTADKTGTGETTTGDVCIYWPTGHAPVVVAAYLAQSSATSARRETILAEIGRIVVEQFGA